MNKQELMSTVKAQCASDIKSNAALSRIIDCTFDAIMDAVASGDTVTIKGFGTFKTSDRAARTGRNPQTGETIMIEAKTVPVFKCSDNFKNMI